jgi:hypothetical protein
VSARSCSSCPSNTYQSSSSHRDTQCKVQPTCGAGELISSDTSTAGELPFENVQLCFVSVS